MLNFPNNPELNQSFTNGTDTWYWNGISWEVRPVSSPSFTNIVASGTITGNVIGNVIGNVTGAVTGTVSDISNHSIDELGNVNAPSPTNAQVLAYNTSSNAWEASTLSSTFVGGTIINPLFVNNSTVSTSSGTGALRVTGGVGVVDDVYIGGHLSIEDEYIDLKARAELRFSDTDNSNYVAFKAPATIASNVTFLLPTSDGDAGQFLQTNGSGTLSWGSASGGGPGGTTPPGGSNTQIQFNNAGAFAGSTSLTYDLGNDLVTVPSLTATGAVSITNTTASTTTTTGSFKTAGGAGIAGQLNVGGATNKFTAATASTNSSTGAMVIAGGVGIGGDVYVDGDINVAALPTTANHATNKAYVDSNVLAFSIAFGV
jgi:hypothetical protein